MTPDQFTEAERLSRDETVFNPQPARATWGETVGLVVFMAIVFGVAICV